MNYIIRLNQMNELNFINELISTKATPDNRKILYSLG